MKKILFIFLVVLYACTSTKDLSKKGDGNISKLVFRHYWEISEEGVESFNTLQDSLFAQLESEIELDSTRLELARQFSLAEIFKATPESEIHIEVNQDTIWRFQIQNGDIIGDFFRVDRTKGILYYHAKVDRNKIYYQSNLFERGGEYYCQEYPNDRKEILGFSCFKVIIRQKEQREGEIPLTAGDTIYEMYVTRDIKLPVHALFNFTKDFSEFFPLEVKSWGEGIAGVQDIYKIKEIK